MGPDDKNYLIKIDAALLDTIKKSFGSDGMPMPFVKEIFLMSCNIAGTSYRDDIAEISGALSCDEILVFRREPQNEHDDLAIAIFDSKGRKIGYVPRQRNEVLARLMDAGKLVFGKMLSKSELDKWIKIDIKVFMKDF